MNWKKRTKPLCLAILLGCANQADPSQQTVGPTSKSSTPDRSPQTSETVPNRTTPDPTLNTRSLRMLRTDQKSSGEVCVYAIYDDGFTDDYCVDKGWQQAGKFKLLSSFVNPAHQREIVGIVGPGVVVDILAPSTSAELTRSWFDGNAIAIAAPSSSIFAAVAVIMNNATTQYCPIARGFEQSPCSAKRPDGYVKTNKVN